MFSEWAFTHQSQSITEVHCNFPQEIRESLEKIWSIHDLTRTKTYTVKEVLCKKN